MNRNNCALNYIDISKITDVDFIFCESHLNGDLTKWLPYSLEFDKDAFKDCTASRTYWANFDNPTDRNQLINNYLSYCELNSEEKFIKENI